MTDTYSHYLGALSGRDVLSSSSLSPEETHELLRVAIGLKAPCIPSAEKSRPLSGRTVALIFEKPSTRTRVTFETAIVRLGGHPIYLTQSDIGMGIRETVSDIAKNMSRWVDGIVARTYKHQTVMELAENASVPVINALSDLEHPCQALADWMTIIEHAGSAMGFTLAWVGDGNNVCHSLMITGARLGANIRVAVPPGYEPDPGILKIVNADAELSGGSILVTNNAEEAVHGSGAIYTDVWTSMGQESEREDRLRIFQPYQLNNKLLQAANPGAFVMHCLPAHRGEEVTAEVIDGPQSIVLDEAENRLHVQEAIIAMTMASSSPN